MKVLILTIAVALSATAAQAHDNVCADSLDAVSGVLDNITDLANDCPTASESLKREYRRLGRENIDLLGRAARNCQAACRQTLPDGVQFCSEVEADAPRMGRQLEDKCR